MEIGSDWTYALGDLLVISAVFDFKEGRDDGLRN